MILRARHLVPMSTPPVEDGAVVVRGEFVEAAGRWADVRRAWAGEEVTDLGEVALLPGFINAHCHLDYSELRNAILPPKGFAEWVGKINALKRYLGPEDYLKAIARGFREQARCGTTTILNIESFPELMWRMPAPPLRTWWFYEMIDVRRAAATEELVAGALLFFQQAAQGHAPEDWLGGTGLSPHAPYTASAELYRLARTVARREGMPWTTHLGESSDEQGMFVRGEGPLYDFLQGVGRPMEDCGRGHSALWTLAQAGCLGPECIAVHLNEWEPEDFALVEAGGALEGMSVVHCPLSHGYFGHRAFPVERLRKTTANLCVGTDSPVSGGSFDLRAELRVMAAVTPGISPEELLRCVTVNPAGALGLQGKLGCVEAGGWADLTAVACPTSEKRNIYAATLDATQPVVWSMVAGQVSER